jgi:uncharacterized phage protein (TIGR01671 family)
MVIKYKAYVEDYGLVDVNVLDLSFQTIEFYYYKDGVPYTETAYINDVALFPSTGLTDKQDNEIFEGDIVRGMSSSVIDFTGYVVYKAPEFKLVGIGRDKGYMTDLSEIVTVIGHIMVKN